MGLRRFDSIYSHGFIRAAVAIPAVRVADPGANAERTIALAKRADASDALLVLFPEMGISAYSNEDLFHQDALLTATVQAIGDIVDASRTLRAVIVVGAPLRIDAKLFNCAIAIHRGRVLGITPKRTCRTIVSSTRSASSQAVRMRLPATRCCSDNGCHSATTWCTTSATSQV